MKVVRDLFHGTAPIPIDMVYNTDLAAAGSTTIYSGSLAKIMDYDDIDHGRFVTFAGNATALENIVGILMEECVSGGGTQLMDASSVNLIRKKICPILPTTLIEAEYVRSDRAGAANYDTAIYTASAGTTLTVPSLTTADRLIGGWIYWLTGNNAGYLHYISDSGTSTSATLATTTLYAGASTDTCLVIQPPLTPVLDFNATYTDIKSEIVPGSNSETVQGLDYYIQAPSMPRRKLNRDLDGTKIANARFFHEFTIPSVAAGGNAWSYGIATS